MFVHDGLRRLAGIDCQLPLNKSQYHNAVACGLAASDIRSGVDIAATHTLPRCGTDFFTTWPTFRDSFIRYRFDEDKH
jgi:hypothetical protein